MPSTSEVAARIRAARGYSGLTARELAAKLNHSVETQSRIENGHRAASSDEIERIVALCDVPIEFMKTGFNLIAERGRTPAQSDLIERLAQIEERVSELSAVRAALGALQRAQARAVVRDMEAQARLSEVESAIRRLQPPRQP